jgi:hypothetical protein
MNAEPVSKSLNLVPITIELECEGRKFNLCFCWNNCESHMSPEVFARTISEENGLPSLMEQEFVSQLKR